MLAPAFSVEHLRGLVPIFYEVTHKARPSPPPVSARPRADDDITAAPAPAHSQLIAAVSARVQRDSADAAEVDVMGWMARAALELIGQTAIGYSFDPLTEDVADAYADAVKRYA